MHRYKALTDFDHPERLKGRVTAGQELTLTPRQARHLRLEGVIEPVVEIAHGNPPEAETEADPELPAPEAERPPRRRTLKTQ